MRFEIRGVPEGIMPGVYPSRIGAPEEGLNGDIVIPVNYAPERSLTCSIYPITVGIDL